jgi:hypothetical protein
MEKKPDNEFECEICGQDMDKYDFDNSDMCPQCLEGE